MDGTYANEFVVRHQPCLILHVKVVRGRNVTNRWGYFYRPDPYVQLRMYRTPDMKRYTTVLNNEPDPEWNETFTYFLDPKNKNWLYVTLFDDNYIDDTHMGRQALDIGPLESGKWIKKTLTFNEGVSEVDLELWKETDHKPELRYSLDLCDEEVEFLKKRRVKTLAGMTKLLGAQAPKSNKRLPTVAVIGSGGGFRAMVGYTGVYKALTECGVADCVSYMGGLSGSAWFVSTLMSHPKWPNISMAEFNEEMKRNIDQSLVWIMTPSRVAGYLDEIMDKKDNGQPVSFTDFFGHLVAETLIKDRLDAKLTDQRAKLAGGDVPMPLYSCVHVKKDVSARTFQEWVEFSPYEIGMPKFGSFMKSDSFGSKFFLGQLARNFPEPPLHFLQGIWGSAFCIMFDRLFEDNKNKDPVEMVRMEMEKSMAEENDLSDGSEDEDEDEDEETATDGKTAKGQAEETLRSDSETAAQEEKSRGFWSGLFETMVSSDKYRFLSTRSGRAGVIHNFLRGIAVDDREDDHVDGINEARNVYSTRIKKQFVVDGGLTFNSPYPLVVRRQRGVNVILSFDFSGRSTDSDPPFRELILAAQWCEKNGYPFPPIDLEEYDRDGLKEMYTFKHPTDPHCPIVLHFTLVNVDFRKFKKPGVPRSTKEEIEFGDFAIFDDSDAPYSTFNFNYTHEAFDRLSQLMEFNTLKHVDDIKKAIAEATKNKSR